MATLVLQAAGAFAGNLIGGPFAALVGQAAGAVAGSMIDQAIFGRSGRRAGPRMTRMPGLAASEGASISRVYGRARTGGALIWATRFEEAVSLSRSGGMGGKGSSPRTTTYSYYANFAIGVCEGPIADIRRIWADGEEIDRTKFNLRIYRGDELQEPDALIVAKEGAANAPAYRGLAYVVFERMPLGDYGNRIPQFSFEVVRPLGGVNEMLRGVCVIPGSAEFAYQPTAVATGAAGVSQSENRHVLTHASDWEASLDNLQAVCPNVGAAALVVSWFGDDLRAGQCTIRPKSERPVKPMRGVSWSVAGLGRSAAQSVSQHEGKPAYGGTPSDASVIAAIRDLKDRGLEVTFYPFVMMDIPAGAARPDPWTGLPNQPAYPWRGKITCDPAPGRAGSPDGSGAAATQLGAFFGSSAPAAGEWSYRRFILHYANLCAQAGGVDAFLIGSELVGLTRVRSASGVYPAVAQLQALAADVKAILGASTKISYAADWTEYGAHVLAGGSEVRFPLDPLWASSAIDFVGLDAYWPLSDWREGTDHADAAVASSVYDLSYLRSRMRAGEAFDWHYASDLDRMRQIRTPIADGVFDKPWMFRQKDIGAWWSNAHRERVGGAELTSPTSWVAAGKPIRIIECGCPAVDRGANAPNVFPDIKSEAPQLPWFSRGGRDDLMQMRFIEAFLGFFDPATEGFQPAWNPISPVYGGRMVDTDRIHLWSWDARPFPAFPQQTSVWADAPAWESGHWLNGRLECAPLDRLVALLLQQWGVEADAPRPQIDAMMDGYALDHAVTLRGALETLQSLFAFDAIVSSGRISFRSRGPRQAVEIAADELVWTRDASFELARAQESELNRALTLNFYDGDSDYRTAAVSAQRLHVASSRENAMDAPLVLARAEGQRRLDVMLQNLWASRETIRFELPPSMFALEVGDHVTLELGGLARSFMIERIIDERARQIEARAIEPLLFDHAAVMIERTPIAPPTVPGAARVEILDLAFASSAPESLQHIAVFADPWPTRMALWKAIGAESFAFDRYIDAPAMIGETLTTLGPGVVGRFDRANALDVGFSNGALQSVETSMLFAGRNIMAVRGDDGSWEILGFLDAQLIAAGQWRLSGLLRGLGAAESLASRTLAAGATVVLLDQGVTPLSSNVSDIGLQHRYRIGPADRDHADPAYVELSASVGLHALKPYAPVRARLVRQPGGVEISFLRRGRLNADVWEPVNIPLGEESEAYEVDIYSGGVLKRTLTASTTSLIYPAAAELVDFGVAQSALDVSIVQMSALAGRGHALRSLLPVLS